MGKLLIDMVYTFHRIYCALARETDLFYIHRVYHHHTLDRQLTLLKNLFLDLLFRKATTQSVWQLRQLLDIQILMYLKDLSKNTQMSGVGGIFEGLKAFPNQKYGTLSAKPSRWCNHSTVPCRLR
jgi:hypothetical protein